MTEFERPENYLGWDSSTMKDIQQLLEKAQRARERLLAQPRELDPRKVKGMTFSDRGTPIGPCELCGKVDEVRPYGRHGEYICQDCCDYDCDPKRYYETTWFVEDFLANDTHIYEWALRP